MHDSWFRTCGDVIFQDVLNGYPLFTGNTPLMLSDSYNPFIHTLPWGIFLPVITFIVCQQTVFIGTLGFFKANV